MKSPAVCLVLCATFLAGATRGAGAFAESGHRIVGLLAERHLEGSRALGEIRKILEPGETLADAAVWPDTIKAIVYEDDETAPFRLEHPAHDTYHWVNLPFQVARYAPAAPGARSGDILQMTIECIRVLRGRSQVFTRREAVRLLAHLVGDVHQPLHIGNGFVAASGRLEFVMPEGATGWRDTVGGNVLVYGPQDRFNLHSYWDAHAVNLAMRADDPRAYASRLFTDVRPGAGWKDEAEPETWPERWVNESLAISREAFAGIAIVAYLGPDEARRTAHRWRIRQPPRYDDLARRVISSQLAKAGYRLAAILRAVWPDRG
ncbi:MAG TPA: S1/P1 nuclease [Vicinamibacterales bacterium]|nr:S1/P1 nuclease [Vicinamibacterales bacterium]